MNIKKPTRTICFLVHSLDTGRGGGRLATGLVENIARTQNTKVRVLTNLSSNSPLEDCIIPSGFIRLLLSGGRIRKVLKEADIIHAFDVFPYGILAVFLSLGLKKKIIITAVGSGSIQPLFSKKLGFLARYAYKRADVCTAISSYVVREIKKHIPNLKISVIIPGIDYEYFAQKIGKSAPFVPKPYVLTVAKVKPRKGLEVALQAFAIIAPTFPNLKYVIVGVCEDTYCSSIKELASSLGIGERVLFKERISDAELTSLYENAELFLLLPQNIQNDIEGFGLVFLEAAALGIPVIGALESGAEDAVLDGRNGYLVAPDDVKDAAEKMQNILSDPLLREKFAKESIEFAKRSDWTTIIKNYCTVYELLLGDAI